MAIRSLADQMPLLSEGAGKNRAMCAGTRREVAIALAALQGAVSGEEQARQQPAVSINNSINIVRKLTASETRTRRAQGQALSKERDHPAAGLQHRDARADSLENQGGQGCKDLRAL